MTSQTEVYLYFNDTIFSMTKDENFTDEVRVTFEWQKAQTIQGDTIVFWRQINGSIIEKLNDNSGTKLFKILSMNNGLGDKLPTAIRNLKGKVIYIN